MTKINSNKISHAKTLHFLTIKKKIFFGSKDHSFKELNFFYQGRFLLQSSVNIEFFNSILDHVIYLFTSSAVSLTARGPNGACELEGTMLRAILLPALGRPYPTLLALLERALSFPTRYARGWDTHTHCVLYRR